LWRTLNTTNEINISRGDSKTKPRRMKWGEHLARMGRKGIHIGYWWEKQKERDHHGNLDVGGRIIFSRVYGCVTSNNGFPIGRLDLLRASFTNTITHNQLQ
jgi:hypothetical protein